MKTHLAPTISALAALLLAAACQKPAFETESPDPAPAVKTVHIRASLADGLTATKMDFSQETGALVLRWSAEDAIRVIGNPGTAAESSAVFSLTEINEGGRTAVFSGEPPAGTLFAVQYPATLDGTATAGELYFSGQVQTGNGNTDHLKSAWTARLEGLTSSTLTSVDFVSSNQPAGVVLSRSGVVKFYLQLPAGVETPTSVSLIAPSPLFFLNKGGSRTDRLSLGLSDIRLSESGAILTAYLATSWRASTVPGGTTLRVEVASEAGFLARDITLTQDLVIEPGQVTVLKLNNSGWIQADYPTTGIYVSPQGSDSSDGSEEHPLLTLEEALRRANPGTTVILRGGTYKVSGDYSTMFGGKKMLRKFCIDKSGAPGNPITVKAYAGETPVLDGGKGRVLLDKVDQDQANLFRHMGWFLSYTPTPEVAQVLGEAAQEGGLLRISGSHIVLEGLTLTGSAYAGIYCHNGASHITVRNCTVTHCGAPGICFGADGSPSTDIKVLNNTVEDCAQMSREGISLRTVDGFEVSGNTVRSVIKESIDAKSGCSNGVICNNRVYDSGHCGIYLDAGFSNVNRVQQNIRVYGNIVSNPYGTAICLASESGNDMRDIHVFNNLACSSRSFSAEASSNSGCGIKVADNGDRRDGKLKDIYIYNNTVYRFGQQGIYVNYPNVENIVIAHNVVWSGNLGRIKIKEGVDASGIRIYRNCSDPYSGDNTGQDHITSNPKFRDAASFDFTLQANSPLKDAIPSGATPVAATDLTGAPRPVGSGYDIGAYEYQGI